MAIGSKTRQQLWRFLISGIIAVIVDYLVYLLLYQEIGHNMAKGISFLSGTIIAYILNKYWTFDDKKFSGNQMANFFALYGFTLALNIVSNYLCLKWTENLSFAFLCATGLSAAVNFVGQKYWVFKTSHV